MPKTEITKKLSDLDNEPLSPSFFDNTDEKGDRDEFVPYVSPLSSPAVTSNTSTPVKPNDRLKSIKRWWEESDLTTKAIRWAEEQSKKAKEWAEEKAKEAKVWLEEPIETKQSKEINEVMQFFIEVAQKGSLSTTGFIFFRDKWKEYEEENDQVQISYLASLNALKAIQLLISSFSTLSTLRKNKIEELNTILTEWIPQSVEDQPDQYLIKIVQIQTEMEKIEKEPVELILSEINTSDDDSDEEDNAEAILSVPLSPPVSRFPSKPKKFVPSHPKEVTLSEDEIKTLIKTFCTWEEEYFPSDTTGFTAFQKFFLNWTDSTPALYYEETFHALKKIKDSISSYKSLYEKNTQIKFEIEKAIQNLNTLLKTYKPDQINYEKIFSVHTNLQTNIDKILKKQENSEMLLQSYSKSISLFPLNRTTYIQRKKPDIKLEEKNEIKVYTAEEKIFNERLEKSKKEIEAALHTLSLWTEKNIESQNNNDPITFDKFKQQYNNCNITNNNLSTYEESALTLKKITEEFLESKAIDVKLLKENIEKLILSLKESNNTVHQIISETYRRLAPEKTQSIQLSSSLQLVFISYRNLDFYKVKNEEKTIDFITYCIDTLSQKDSSKEKETLIEIINDLNVDRQLELSQKLFKTLQSNNFSDQTSLSQLLKIMDKIPIKETFHLLIPRHHTLLNKAIPWENPTQLTDLFSNELYINSFPVRLLRIAFSKLIENCQYEVAATLLQKRPDISKTEGFIRDNISNLINYPPSRNLPQYQNLFRTLFDLQINLDEDLRSPEECDFTLMQDSPLTKVIPGLIKQTYILAPDGLYHISAQDKNKPISNKNLIITDEKTIDRLKNQFGNDLVFHLADPLNEVISDLIIEETNSSICKISIDRSQHPHRSGTSTSIKYDAILMLAPPVAQVIPKLNKQTYILTPKNIYIVPANEAVKATPSITRVSMSQTQIDAIWENLKNNLPVEIVKPRPLTAGEKKIITEAIVLDNPATILSNALQKKNYVIIKLLLTSPYLSLFSVDDLKKAKEAITKITSAQQIESQPERESKENFSLISIKHSLARIIFRENLDKRENRSLLVNCLDDLKSSFSKARVNLVIKLYENYKNKKTFSKLNWSLSCFTSQESWDLYNIMKKIVNAQEQDYSGIGYYAVEYIKKHAHNRTFAKILLDVIQMTDRQIITELGKANKEANNLKSPQPSCLSFLFKPLYSTEIPAEHLTYPDEGQTPKAAPSLESKK